MMNRDLEDEPFEFSQGRLCVAMRLNSGGKPVKENYIEGTVNL